MKTKFSKGALNMPRLTRDETASAVQKLSELLGVPQGIFKGPLASGRLPLDSLPDYRWERLNFDFLKKYPGFDWGNPREEAVRRYHQSEEECRLTNQRIRIDSLSGYESLALGPYIRRAQKLILAWLGDSFDWRDLLPHGRFGPGVTSSAKGFRLHASQKFGAKPEVTPAFARTGCQLIAGLPSWSCLIAGIDYPAWVTPLPQIVPGNRVTFVPKDSTTDRGIAVEPTVNIYFQLAMGSILRDRLRSAGVDLNTQEVNQRLAQLGSLDDSLSTIDLERASDTLSWRTVFELLPVTWFEALDRLRSQFGTLDGAVRPYHKFSSMGNGFTFELESMIFYALCLSVAQLDGYNPFWVTAYGDDLIVPSGCYDRVSELLAWAGFTVNAKKSYSSGPFRESCGKDYLRGSLVRPVYLKEIPDTPLAWIKIANSLKRLANTWNEYSGLDSRLKPAYDFSVSMIPRFYRQFSVGDGYGDVALLRDFDDARPTQAPGGWEGFMTRVIMPRPIRWETNDRCLITAGVSHPGMDGNKLPLRGKVEHTIGSLFVANWRDLGAWS
jgi:hypothetical protein